MKKTGHIFHLAIPCHNLNEAKNFYVNKLGAKLARSYKDRITLNFFGDQLVCHLAPDKIDTNPNIYPRHFGITFQDFDQYQEMLILSKTNHLKFFTEPFVRFPGHPEEHHTFFLCDPSNNLLEFKYYYNSEMMY